MQLCKWLCGLNSFLIIYYIKMTDDRLLRYDFYFENSVSGLTLHFFFLLTAAECGCALAFAARERQ